MAGATSTNCNPFAPALSKKEVQSSSQPRLIATNANTNTLVWNVPSWKATWVCMDIQRPVEARGPFTETGRCNAKSRRKALRAAAFVCSSVVHPVSKQMRGHMHIRNASFSLKPAAASPAVSRIVW